MRLPQTLEQLRGLRAARWVRESTAGQQDRFGPDSQREQQDRALERYGLVDTGHSWSVAHSGWRKLDAHPTWVEMVAAAGREYDVLLVGYVSRWSRNLKLSMNARDELHAAGGALFFCDERILSSDEDQWEQFAREAVEAEAYSRRLGKRIREGYAAKFRRLADQGGQMPMGFHRVEPARTLAIDPSSIGKVVAVFERYANGDVSYEQVGQSLGIEAGSIRELLRNPIYNGFVRRYRRSAQEERQPAAWRDNPPVSDDLWERVQTIKARRTRSSGQRSPNRTPPLLSGLLECACGTKLRANGSQGKPARPVVIHPGTCELWGDRRTYPTAWYDDAIGAQVSSIHLDDLTLARIVSALTSAPRPSGTGKVRLERRKRELALEHAASRLTDAQYLEAVAVLRQEQVEEAPSVRLEAADVLNELRRLPALWQNASPEKRRNLATGVYERIVVRGRTFVRASLTPWAEARGLLLALPERIERVSREGDRLIRSRERIPLEGRRDWMARSA